MSRKDEANKGNRDELLEAHETVTNEQARMEEECV